MNEAFNIELAGVVIRIEPKYGYIRDFCRNYITDKPESFSVSVSAEEIAAVIAPQFPDSDLAVLTAVTQRHLDIDAWNAVPRMEQAALERLETVMEGAGELTREQWVDYGAIVDNSFADAAMK